MDLVPDSVGRDNNGFSFRDAAPNQAPVNGAAHRRAQDPAAAEEVAAAVTSDPAIADHPLVAGLLVELPARGTPLPDGWLDRWLEAARACLELLYTKPTR
jgi:hypothetical protein